MAEVKEVRREAGEPLNRVFARIFGDEEGNFEFTAANVREAVGRLRVNGQPYAEKYGIGEINENNYQAAVQQVMENLTSGSSAKSFREGEARDVEAVTILGKNPGDPLFSVLQPSAPFQVARPEGLTLWQRVMGVFGFYKEEREAYESQAAEYQAASRAMQEYSDRMVAAVREAEAMENRVREICEPDRDRVRGVREAFASEEKREALQSAARSVRGLRIPGAEEAEAASRQYMADYRSGMASSFGFSSLQSPNQLNDAIRAYAMARGNGGNGMTAAEFEAATPEQKAALGEEFRSIFRLGAEGEATDEEKNRLADTIRSMCDAFARTRIPQADLTNPEDVRLHGEELIRISRTAATLRGLLSGNDEITALIRSKGTDVVKSARQLDSVYGYCQQAWSVLNVYAQDGFREGTLSATAENQDSLKAAGNFLLLGDRLSMFSAKNSIGELDTGELGLADSILKAGNDGPEELAGLFNGRPEASIGRVTPEFIAETAALLPQNALNGQYQAQLAAEAAQRNQAMEAAEETMRQEQAAREQQPEQERTAENQAQQQETAAENRQPAQREAGNQQQATGQRNEPAQRTAGNQQPATGYRTPPSDWREMARALDLDDDDIARLEEVSEEDRKAVLQSNWEMRYGKPPERGAENTAPAQERSAETVTQTAEPTRMADESELARPSQNIDPTRLQELRERARQSMRNSRTGADMDAQLYQEQEALRWVDHARYLGLDEEAIDRMRGESVEDRNAIIRSLYEITGMEWLPAGRTVPPKPVRQGPSWQDEDPFAGKTEEWEKEAHELGVDKTGMGELRDASPEDREEMLRTMRADSQAREAAAQTAAPAQAEAAAQTAEQAQAAAQTAEQAQAAAQTREAEAATQTAEQAQAEAPTQAQGQPQAAEEELLTWAAGQPGTPLTPEESRTLAQHLSQVLLNSELNPEQAAARIREAMLDGASYENPAMEPMGQTRQQPRHVGIRNNTLEQQSGRTQVSFRDLEENYGGRTSSRRRENGAERTRSEQRDRNRTSRPMGR